MLVVVTRIVERSPVMNKKFIVRLSVEERAQLESLVAKGKAAAQVDPCANSAEGRL